MTNKFQMQLDLDGYESELVHEALERAALRSSKSVKKDTLNDLKARIQLAWTKHQSTWGSSSPLT